MSNTKPGRPSEGKTSTCCLSMDPETKERLRMYALERRCSVSQLVTEWIWNVKLKTEGSGEEAR